MTEPPVDRTLVTNPIRPAYQQVADQLRARILDGELLPGDRLPVESQLAALFDVSRSTIREALRVLSSERLLRTVRGVGGGSFVLQPDPEHVSDFLETSIGLLSGTHQVSLAELIEVRTRLEVAAARQAVHRASDEQIEELRAAASAELAATTHGYTQASEFHVVLLRAAGNRLMEVLAAPVFNVLGEVYLGEISDAAWAELGRDHAAIVAAIASRDADAAAEAMALHVAAVARIYRADPPR